MRYVWDITRFHLQRHNRVALLLITLFGAIIVLVNEQFELYEKLINQQPNPFLQTLYYMVMYVGVYAVSLIIIAVCNRSWSVLKHAKVWLILIAVLLLFSIRGLESVYWALIPNSLEYSYQMAWFKITYNLAGVVFTLLPCYLYYRWSQDANQAPFYGFKSKGVRLRPYWMLIIVMAPFIAWAAQEPSFHTMYPRYQFLGVPVTDRFYSIYLLVYEAAYSLDFVVTEFLFRGFLLFALGRFIGFHTVMPMAILYITIHFGKPLAEVISSFFGGMLLGAIAWETRSIYGGIIVHLGIALLMEVCGALL